MGWTAIPSGTSLALAPGNAVAVVASVKASHSQADLDAFAQKRGITVVDYAEQGQRPGLGPDPNGPGYRYVAAAGTASQAVSVPWQAPWPLSMFDESQLVEAWVAPSWADVGGTAAGPPPPGPPAPTRPPLMPSTGADVVIVGGGALLLWLLSRRRRRGKGRG